MGRTKQVQKTRTAGTKLAVTQKQSLEAVQTLIHGGLSCLMYMRELFAENAFDFRTYQMGPITPYDDYANGKLPTSSKGVQKPALNIKILRRNRSRRVDTFLDWLEKGAFPLLAAGRLQAIQICVHEDQHQREKVIESYAFAIKYEDDGSGSKSPVGVKVGRHKSEPANVGQANSNLQEVLGEIQKICKTLPHLPANRFVSTELFLCSEDNVPPEGFVPSNSDKQLFAHAEGWEKQTQTKSLGTKFHSTNFKISHLVLQDDPDRDDSDHPIIPDHLDYPEIVARVKELGLDEPSPSAAEQEEEEEEEEEEAITVVEDTPTKASSPPKRASSVTMISEIPARKHQQNKSNEQIPTPTRTSQVPQPNPTQRRQSDARMADSESAFRPGPNFFDNLDTQSSHVPKMRRALRSMMNSEPLTQGDTQTQAVMRSVPPTPSQVGRDATPTTASGLDLRDSAIPYRTPILPGHKGAKRRHDDENEWSTPARRTASNGSVFKRLKSVQSQMVLNASGLPSSSPAPWAGS